MFLPNMVKALTTRYQFLNNNSTDREAIEKDGITFEAGYWEGRSIRKLALTNATVYVDGEVSTEDSQQMLLEILEWAHAELGANFHSKTIRRWAYVSDIVFETDFPLLRGQDSVLSLVADRVSATVSENLREELAFQPSVLTLGHDPATRISTVAPFSIQHRFGNLFSENIFLSEAPVPTTLHLELIEQIETQFRKNYEGR